MKQKGHNNKFQTILKRLEKYLENTDNLKTNIVESLYVWSEKSFGTLHILYKMFNQTNPNFLLGLT